MEKAWLRGFKGEQYHQLDKDYSYDVLAKNVAAFCLCPKKKNLQKAKLKINFIGRGDFKIA